MKLRHFLFAWLYANNRDIVSGWIFAFDAVLIAYSLAFSGSIGCNSCSLPLSGFPFTALPNPLAGFMGGILVTGMAEKEKKGINKGWRGVNGSREGNRSVMYGPFPTFSAVTPRHDNKLNENHRLDSDLSTYNKLGLNIINLYLGFITLCITEMAMHWNYPAKMLESEIPTIECMHERHRQTEYVRRITGSHVRLKLRNVYMVYYSFMLSYIEH